MFLKPSLTDSKLFFVFYIPICPSLKSHKEAIHVEINKKNYHQAFPA
jgi:hypothetical protein